MHAAFGTVVVVVCAIALVLALIALARSNRTWAEHGKGGLLLERDLPHEPRAAGPAGPMSTAERDTEIRELLEARNARRARRGEPPLDVEQELARLIRSAAGAEPSEATPPDAPAVGREPSESIPSAVDPELREEIRQLVLARNHRRVRAGKPPLDVEAEIERELRRVSGMLG